ncbi:Multidrug export protein EmrB [Bradyrhizobium ivorense]|uniref:Multidrug export protein EmrB n=1 Tax=Bradyrhizobium ivorense TaxID=2511166 RepID=A0A508STJ1_9BRAD|nr:MFS transporter [Bradyrhizobium ivorense]VIO66255.1 Multidrug export protein EmrB [Bradyrhizobium ivorense]
MTSATISSGPDSASHTSHRPLLAVGAVLLGAFIASFDVRLFALGLPDLRGKFGLSFDEGAWLTTASTAPQILIAPAVAWLATVFGLRRVLIGPSLLYIVVSLAIPLVRDYQMLLALHLVRGLLLGIFVPATIMIVLHNMPMKWWIVGLAAYSFRLSFTGNAGVSLVGFYVDHVGWQWLYWQDAVVALLMALLTWLGTPAQDVNRQLMAQADWGGMLLLGAGLALIYAGCDQGNRLDWFESGTVTGLIVAGGALVFAFLVNEALVPEPWASPTVLFSRNVALVLLTMMTYMVTSLSNTMLVPNFLTVVVGLRPEQIGQLFLLYVALPLLIAVPAAVWLLRRIDARIVVLLGLTSFAIAAWMGTRITQEWAPANFIPMALVQAVGQGLTFTGLLIFVLSNANPARATAFVAYIQVMRLDVIEIAVTAMTTWLRVRQQVHSNLIGLHVFAEDGEVTRALGALTGKFVQHSAAAETALARAMGTMASLVRREANVLSIIDGFQVAFWAAIIGLLLVSLMRAAPPGPLTPPIPANGSGNAH